MKKGESSQPRQPASSKFKELARKLAASSTSEGDERAAAYKKLRKSRKKRRPS